MTSLTAFPRFGELSMELQLLVWQHAAAPEAENVLTFQDLGRGLRPSWGFRAVWTTVYAIFLDIVAWNCQGAYSCRKQMMRVSRLCRQVAFEAWKKDVEAVFSTVESERAPKTEAQKEVQPWRSSTMAQRSYGMASEPVLLSNRTARELVGQLELFEDLTVVHSIFWGQSPWNAAHGRLNLHHRLGRHRALEHRRGQSMIRGCPCGGTTASPYRGHCFHASHHWISLKDTGIAWEYETYFGHRNGASC